MTEKLSVSIPEGPLGSTRRTVPLVGFGTANYPFGSFDDIKQSVLNAIEVGYRHFDTAALYFSEIPLGEAIAEALRLGLIKSRDELFVTSKLWITDAHPHRVLPALQKSLKNLGLNYLDLYLIHWPVSSKQEGLDWDINKEDLLPLDFENVWKAMEECQKAGLTRSIGVSNFSCKKLEKLLATAKITPAVNQVEMNPCWQQKKLREFCKEKGIHITAYCPLGAKGSPWGSNQVMDSERLKELAKAKGKTLAQVCLRWVHEQGVGLLVKSFNQERMRENLEIFDWSLNPQELSKIEQLPQNRGTLFEFIISDDGPFKSLDELWDGEL